MTNALTEREEKILDLIMERPNLGIGEISTLLQVSRVTVRNDFNNLADKGFLVRTRGGGLPVFHTSIIERQKRCPDAKNRIAREAARMVREGDTVMIGSGTTTGLVGKYLLGKRDVHVVTNSSLLLPYARQNLGMHLTVIGGRFRRATESINGATAVAMLDQFHVRYAFIGTDGFTLDTGLTTHLVEEAEILKKMNAQAQETVLLADSTKYGRKGFTGILPVTDIDMIISDAGLDADIIRRLEDLGIKILIAGE